MFTKEELDQLVTEIAERETKPVIDVSIEQIAGEIESRTGYRPSKSRLWFSLQRIGAKASGRKYIYEKNKSKETAQ